MSGVSGGSFHVELYMFFFIIIKMDSLVEVTPDRVIATLLQTNLHELVIMR